MPPRVRRGGAGGRRIPTPFPWDPDLPANQTKIQFNYDSLLIDVVNAGRAGIRPADDIVRDWHRSSLRGVAVSQPQVAGGYRGEGAIGTPLSVCINGVRGVLGANPIAVPTLVTRFFTELHRRLDDLDTRREAGEALDRLYPDVVRTAAWAHGEWVRIHPFADHNGSTARLMTVTIGLLYGVHFKLPGKPRSAMPNQGLLLDYNQAARDQMLGNDQNMVVVLNQLAQ